MKRVILSAAICVAVILCFAGAANAAKADRDAKKKSPDAGKSKTCVMCHKKHSAALVMEWERSRHAEQGVGCLDCHAASKEDPDAWEHNGHTISVLVTPKDCSQCHADEVAEFSSSHHARGGEIIASLDNVLAEKAAGMPGNVADAVNGCWQCHGTIVKLLKNEKGEVIRDEKGKPAIDPNTWPNSGIGRLNLDGSRGSCNACHSRHSFESKIARQPENCGKCHMGPDHPQLEIFNESKHGIAYNANKDIMALDSEGEWVLGKTYSAAPSCASCHISSYMTPDGATKAKSHDVGNRISWTLRPVVSTRINEVSFTDGYKETYPESKALPKIGDEIDTTEKYVDGDKLASRTVKRKVASVRTWEERRNEMKGVCQNCHDRTHTDNFYKQYDDLVILYNEKFAKPAQKLMDQLVADGILNPKAPFEHEVQWTFYELWHHQGRRARHGASMMGPDYTHWHGMYEVAKTFYVEFLPQVVETAAEKSPELKKKYEGIVEELTAGEAHRWRKGMTAEEAAEILKQYQERYGKQ